MDEFPWDDICESVLDGYDTSCIDNFNEIHIDDIFCQKNDLKIAQSNCKEESSLQNLLSTIPEHVSVSPAPNFDKQLRNDSLAGFQAPNNGIKMNLIIKSSPTTMNPGFESSAEDVCEQEMSKDEKSPHNAIEKRYRMSINDKIDYLREILVKSGFLQTKMNKSAVLKSAISRIEYLERENEILKSELSKYNTKYQNKSSYDDSGICSSASNSSASPFSSQLNLNGGFQSTDDPAYYSNNMINSDKKVDSKEVEHTSLLTSLLSDENNNALKTDGENISKYKHFSGNKIGIKRFYDEPRSNYVTSNKVTCNFLNTSSQYQQKDPYDSSYKHQQTYVETTTYDKRNNTANPVALCMVALCLVSVNPVNNLYQSISDKNVNLIDSSLQSSGYGVMNSLPLSRGFVVQIGLSLIQWIFAILLILWACGLKSQQKFLKSLTNSQIERKKEGFGLFFVLKQLLSFCKENIYIKKSKEGSCSLKNSKITKNDCIGENLNSNECIFDNYEFQLLSDDVNPYHVQRLS